MKDIAIRIENLSKRYTIGKEKDGSLRGTLNNLVKGRKKKSEEFWALKDINLEIEKGDVVGIIGKNGAGKSTLLKILSQITRPTTGRIEINGRVASLLEVGTGFHPELTGRENIYLNGTILGMTRKEVSEKFEEIVTFSGVEKFIDTPVKHYSSGMYVRLAFSVAAHLEPEILIIDEVLAVGDAEFQKKCLGKMQDVADQGRTVLFVSHNMVAVQSLCNKGIVLDSGKGIQFDKVYDALSFYLSDTNIVSSKYWKEYDAPGNDFIRLESIDIKPLLGERIHIASGFTINLGFHNRLVNSNIDLTLELLNDQGLIVFHVGTTLTENRESEVGYFKVSATIPKDFLNAGNYSINLIFGENGRRAIYTIDRVITFEIKNHSHTNNMEVLPGVVKPLLNWSKTFTQNPLNAETN